jgi:hypothetical protein
VELIVEFEEVAGIQEVNEAVPHIALIFGVAGQVEEIVSVGEDLVDFLGELLNRVFVWDISDHYCSPRIIPYIFDLDRIGRAFVELLEPIVLAVVHVILLALLIGVHVIAHRVDINCASIALLEGLHRPYLCVYRRVELLRGLGGLLICQIPLTADIRGLAFVEDGLERTLDNLFTLIRVLY